MQLSSINFNKFNLYLYSFFILNIVCINLIGVLNGYHNLAVYYSLFILFFCISYDISVIYKHSQINVRIFLILGSILWYYMPMLNYDLSQNDLTQNIIINYSLFLIFVSKKFEVIISKDNLLIKTRYLYLMIIIYTAYKLYSIDDNIIMHILNSRKGSTSEDYINLNATIFDTLIAIIDSVYQIVISYGLYISFIKKKYFTTFLFLLLIVFVSIETGFRSLMIFLFFPVFFVLLAKKKFLKIGLGILSVILFAQFLLVNRTTNQNTFSDLNAIEAVVKTSDLYIETKFVIDNSNLFTNSKQNDIWIYTTFLIPRSIYNNKPIPNVIRDFTYSRWGIDVSQEGGNVFPGIYMNFYLSYGFLFGGLLLIIFQYVILFFFNIIYAKNNSVFFLSLLCANIFLNFRSNSPMFYYYVLAPFFVLTLYKLYATNNEINQNI